MLMVMVVIVVVVMAAAAGICVLNDFWALCYRTSNSWMDQDATWYGGRLGPGHIVLDGDPAPPRKGAQQLPHFSDQAPCLLWPNDCPSQQLLSCCYNKFVGVILTSELTYFFAYQHIHRCKLLFVEWYYGRKPDFQRSQRISPRTGRHCWWVISEIRSLYFWLASSCTCTYRILFQFTTVVLRRFFTLSLPAQNLSVSQVFPAMDSFSLRTADLHKLGHRLDLLSWSVLTLFD